MNTASILYIVGTGGFAKEVAQLASDINAEQKRWTTIGYICETESERSKPMPFGSVLGTDSMFDGLSHCADFAVGIGSPQIRAKLGKRLLAHPKLRAPNLIHPDARLDTRFVSIGQGNIVTRGTTFTCDITVGDLNVFNLHCTVGHDTHFGSFNVINPGCNISGGVRIEDTCLFGTGCQILESVSIASRTTVGAGAVVIRNVDFQDQVLVGIPAKPLINR